jgi:thioredoxin 1
LDAPSLAPISSSSSPLATALVAQVDFLVQLDVVYDAGVPDYRQGGIMSGKTVNVTDASFEDDVLRADRPVIVDFWAEWCMPCQLVAPILEEIAEEQAGRLTVAKLNVDENPATADTYRVRSIPLMGVFSGGELVKSILGARPKPAIMDELAEFLR